MKRHPALQDLSRDHFHVLFRCQQLRKLLERDAPAETVKHAVDDLLAFFGSDMSPHFLEEDDLVVPQAIAAGAPDLRQVAKGIKAEHVELRDSFAKLAKSTTSTARLAQVRRLIEWLPRHVKQEEEELFEGVQKALSEEQLAELGRRSAEFRKQHRRPTGPRAGRG